MNPKILTKLIKSDAALRGFTATDLPMAAKLRAINTATSLKRYFNDEELAQIAAWAESSGGFDAAVAKFRSGRCCYYVCACYWVCVDGSIYFQASALDSEVWADASDFAVKRILNGYEGALDAMDAGLLKHLGGYLAEAVDERGAR